ncbi:hypothetical protein CKN80_01920 [Carnobacterium divergens]|uniref:heparinase II/III family protein n=1 Tax=Carnobacterium divergens TaxID=2748 RepID=UPI0010723703|nr:heparinase II/III family protein [Carnobacterium divergens]TFJ47523.1 hypothetical protein CKN79_01920 [Carnobacterium divergens]TFJ54563.1 hypothetical protein CKN80_01920 [Carnobacterium divergens]
MKKYYGLWANLLKGKKIIYINTFDDILKKLNKQKNVDKRVEHFFSKEEHSNFKNQLNLDILNIQILDKDKLTYLCNEYEDHFFDILGSGWVSADYDSVALGFENFRYECITKECKTIEFEKSYKLIDWHKDIKTGYRFEGNTQYGHSTIPEGVDVKMPWELSRCYHLPQLALGAMVLDNKRREYVLEVKNQLIDFFETNPVNEGINWESAMEVSIRASNMLIAMDIISQLNCRDIIDETFIKYFNQNILLHGKFIVRNLELNYVNNKNGNHYLANLTGLLFISSYLESSITKKWFEFANTEFNREFNNQFLNDGATYEGSSAYHRLSSELSLFSIVLLLKKSNKNFEDFGKFSKVIEFLLMTTKSNGDIIQIGDNDSGRLFKLNLHGDFINSSMYQRINKNLANYESVYNKKIVFIENELSAIPLLSELAGFSTHKNLKQYEYSFEASFVKSLMGEKYLGNYLELANPEINLLELNNEFDMNELKNLKYETSYSFKFKKNIENGELKVAPIFGLITYECLDFKLCIRSVSNLENMLCSHIHNDFLHFEFSNNEKTYFGDQGSYIYTANKKYRNKYRSTSAHNSPNHNIEYNQFSGDFNVVPETKGEILCCTDSKILIRLDNFKFTHYRLFEIKLNSLIISDFSNHEFNYKPKEFQYRSLGYGKSIEHTEVKDSYFDLERRI